MMISMLRRRLQRLRDQGERGSILILVVLSALIIVGSTGLAVDVGRLYAAKAELSRAVDAAALSGVLEFNGTAAGLTNAKTAASNFKDTLLGSSPSGNVYVGIAPLRGCYQPSPGSDTDCVYNTVQSGSPPPTYVKDLTSDISALNTAISAVVPGGMSATNVCTGLGKGYEV